MGITARVFGVDKVVGSLTAARRAAGRGVEREMRRELIRGENQIHRKYRRKAFKGPDGTMVVSNTLDPSYTMEVKRQRGTLEYTGRLGLFGLGTLPIYFRRWENDLPGVVGRPRKGAIEAVRPGVTRRLFRATTRVFTKAVT